MMDRRNPNLIKIENMPSMPVEEKRRTQRDTGTASGSGSLAAFRRQRTKEGRPARFVEFRKSVDRRSLLLQDIFGSSGRRGSSTMSSIVSSITLTDFDQDSFLQSFGSMRWQLDETLMAPQEDDEEGFDDSYPTKRDSNSTALPSCPTRRESIESEKISIGSRHLTDFPEKRTSSERAPAMPWRKSSVQRLNVDCAPVFDCKPVKPGRQVSVSTQEEGAMKDDSNRLPVPCLTRALGRRSLGSSCSC